MTERLYDHGHCMHFTATVLSCTSQENSWAVKLDRTAFFPGGGGQSPDSGSLGDGRVIGMYETAGEIIHLVDKPLTVNETVDGQIDEEPRLRRMQNHSGEHILSGLFFREYGLSNVGFHMGSEDITLDLDGKLTPEQLARIESMANHIVAQNLPVSVCYPERDALENLAYRSKLDLRENVRIVMIGENGSVDRCACCAPHVEHTGEIGMIKLLDCYSYKRGMRLHMLCGLDALDDYRRKYASISTVACALSVKQNDIAAAIARQSQEISAAKARQSALCARLIDLHTASLPAHVPALLFEPLFSPDALRRLVNAALNRTETVLALCGDEESGYMFILGSKTLPCLTLRLSLHAALGGKSGGTDTMVQGRIPASREAIEAWWTSFIHSS